MKVRERWNVWLDNDMQMRQRSIVSVPQMCMYAVQDSINGVCTNAEHDREAQEKM